MITDQTRLFSSDDVSALLKVKNSTLRKYALILERKGYKFHKNEQGRRGYLDQDIVIFKKMMEIKQHPDMTLEQACEAVLSWINSKDATDIDTSIMRLYTSNNKRYSAELIREFHKLQEFNQVLLNQLKKQQQEIDYKIDAGNREILAAIHELKEEQPQLKETTSDIPKKKKKFWPFWK